MYIPCHISKYIAKYLQYIIVYLFLKGMEWNNKFNHVRLVKKKKLNTIQNLMQQALIMLHLFYNNLIIRNAI